MVLQIRSLAFMLLLIMSISFIIVSECAGNTRDTGVRTLDWISIKGVEPDLGGTGHYWIEIYDEYGKLIESYGWFPTSLKTGLNLPFEREVLAVSGVPGVLNAGYDQDPVAIAVANGEVSADWEYHPVLTNTLTDEQVLDNIHNFVKNYEGDWEILFRSCHTFQQELMNNIGLVEPVSPDGTVLDPQHEQNTDDSLDYYRVDSATVTQDSKQAEQSHFLPKVNHFSVALPTTRTLGESFEIDYIVSCNGGLGLKQVELWRTRDKDKWPEYPIQTKVLANENDESGSFMDSPTAPGKYWYGVHVVDNAGNWNDEGNSNTNGQPSGFEPVGVNVNMPEISKASTRSSSEEWIKTFGGAGDDGVGAGAYPMQSTADGGYIIAGSTNSYGEGGSDAWLIKTDADGNKIWEKNFGGASDDWANSVQQTSDGGYILAGGTQSFGAGGMDFWLIKTDAEGNNLWDRTFGGWGNEIANSVQQTDDGGYILAGAGPGDAWLIKTDSNGNKIWDEDFGGSNNDWAHLVEITSDGGYILGGRKDARGSASGDAWIIKTDAEGNELWERTFGGSDTDMINSVQPTSDGGYILAGWTYSYGTGGGDLWIIKTDSEGNKLWDKTFGGAYSDQALSVQSITDNGYILAGGTESYGAGSGDAWLIKTDAEGNELWNKTFGGVNWDGIWAIQPNYDGSNILAGTTDSYGAGSNDAWLIKVAPA